MEELIKYLNDPAFKAAFAADPELDRLERQMRLLPVDSRRELAAMLDGGLALVLGGKTVTLTPPSPGVIALLYLADSPFLMSGQPLHRLDILTALYIILHGRAAVFATAADLELKVMAFFRDSGDIDFRELTEDLIEILRIAFRPYDLLPKSESSPRTAPVYDASWLAGLIIRVAGVTNLIPEQIIWSLPMSVAAQYDLQYRRYVLKCTDAAVRHGNNDASAAYWARVDQFVDDYCRNHQPSEADHA